MFYRQAGEANMAFVAAVFSAAARSWPEFQVSVSSRFTLVLMSYCSSAASSGEVISIMLSDFCVFTFAPVLVAF